MNKFVFAIAILFLGESAMAGVFEVSASSSYRKSVIDEFNFTTSQSYTASVSYYFFEMSAIELSYTQGESRLSAQPTGSDQIIYVTEFLMYGADLVLTFAGRQSAFQPFLKVGAAEIKKEIRQENAVQEIDSPDPEPETVPSGGIGFKIKLTNTFAIKVGVDGWITNMGEEDETVDYAGRAGISWMF